MTLLDLLRILRTNKFLIALTTLVGILAAALYSLLQPVYYQSTATGVVVAGGNSDLGSSQSGQNLAARKADGYVQLLNTQQVRDRIAEFDEIKANPEAASGGLTATVVPGNTLVNLTATGSTPENAALLADVALQALADEAAFLETRTVSNTTDGQGEGQQVPDPASLVVALVPYSPAVENATPVTVNWKLFVLLGAVAGFLLGVGLAIARKALDVRIRTSKDVEEVTGKGVLGVIPEAKELTKTRAESHKSARKVKKEDRGTADSEDSPVKPLLRFGVAGEALRRLRTNLRYTSIDNPPRVIVVTSSNPGEGKSTISSSLARLIARSGQPTVLIDADLRRPVLHRVFGLDSKVGMTQVLASQANLRDVMRDTEEKNLKVIAAGRIPPNPSEIIGSKRMREVIAALSKHYFVILDAPPMLAVTDAGVLATATDGVILVCRADKTMKDQVRHATKLIEQVGGNVLGSVLNRVNKRSMAEAVYGTGYGYGGYYSKYSSYYSGTPVEIEAVEVENADPAPRTPSSPDLRPPVHAQRAAD